MATDGVALVEGRAGITFGVELYVPWDAAEAVVDIHSAGVVPLGSIPDVIALTGHRLDAAESRVLQGRDVRSVRVLVPDSRGVDQNFHDVTIVDTVVGSATGVVLAPPAVAISVCGEVSLGLGNSCGGDQCPGCTACTVWKGTP